MIRRLPGQKIGTDPIFSWAVYPNYLFIAHNSLITVYGSQISPFALSS